MALYGVGMCPVCADSLACLESRETREIVFFCPLCGLAFAEPPPLRELKEVVRLDELAPAGVALPTREHVEAFTHAEIVELNGQWERWVEEVLWQPPAPGESDEEATKAHFDRWYSG